MKTAVALGTASFLFAITISATSVPAPTELALDGPDPRGWTPMPTKAPALPHGGLVKRTFTTVCGYVNGVSVDSIDCAPGICGFNTFSSAFGCCSSTYVSAGETYLSDCGFYTSCLDSTQGCDEACLSNTAVMFCGSASYPYCAPLAYGSSFTNYFCDASTPIGTTPQPVLATWIYGGNSSIASVTPVGSSSPAYPASSSAVVYGSSSAAYVAPSETGSASNIAVVSPSPTPFSQSQQFGYATSSNAAASTSTATSGGIRTGVTDSVSRVAALVFVITAIAAYTM